jgi:carbamoyl-phosphate synthase large subunit
LDKLEFSEFGKKERLDFIPTSLSISQLDSETFVVKERFGAGGNGIGINLDKEAALTHAYKLDAPIFQPFIKGIEISIDAYLTRKNEVKGLVLRRRDIVENGESKVTSTFRSSEIEKQCAVILSALELTGPVVMQCLIDDTGNLSVIECNARFGGASTTGIMAGLDPFYWGIIETTGDDLENYTFNRSERDIRQIRVTEDIYEYDSYL